MTTFICPKCEKVFDDCDTEDYYEVLAILDVGTCSVCEKLDHQLDDILN